MTRPEWPSNVPPTMYALDDDAPTQEIPVVRAAGVPTRPGPARNVGWRIFVGSAAVLIVLVALVVGWAVAGDGTTPAPSPVRPTAAAPPPSLPTDPPAPVATVELSTVAPEPPAPARAITAREWQLIAKNPGSHIGERIVVHGQVTQFDAATGVDGFRANVDGINHKPRYGWADYDTNTMLAGSTELLADVVQGDLFRAEVTVLGALSYDTQIGGSTTVPNLMVTAITVTGHV